MELGLQLVHWWSYDTCRHASFGDDSSWNMNMTDFPESVALIKAANEALKAKWLVNRADGDVNITDQGDTDSTSAESDPTSETTAPTAPDITDAPDETKPSGKGCGASLLGLWSLAVTAMGWMLLKKKES